ncbi:hypothetical protein QWZ16_14095 [Vibrio ostreicida]|uniref:Uncharacterized protein n=1 Tax=Vibrio ostreicida TaxID=526588 RepID=A0ABT8BUJ2_9VIBR|nr:hypothetical protein [Vibrio ostreicida]MDN3610832.1 hypothetical protein [Vibrio ostreicida]
MKWIHFSYDTLTGFRSDMDNILMSFVSYSPNAQGCLATIKRCNTCATIVCLQLLR